MGRKPITPLFRSWLESSNSAERGWNLLSEQAKTETEQYYSLEVGLRAITIFLCSCLTEIAVFLWIWLESNNNVAWKLA